MCCQNFITEEKIMSKTILITGATDGIGLATAKKLVEAGHHVLLHGRNLEKLKQVEAELKVMGTVDSFLADLSEMDQVKSLAEAVVNKYSSLDVLINNAGVLNASITQTVDGFDMRFAVNTIAPYRLTIGLLPILQTGRVINLSSAAQSPVNVNALLGKSEHLDAMNAYSQSKLAITMWSRALSAKLGENGPMIVAVNPGSLLASKMVKEGFGIAGNDLGIGADILVRAALSDQFNNASGKYFDNDIGSFASPHTDAIDEQKCNQLLTTLERLIN